MTVPPPPEQPCRAQPPKGSGRFDLARKVDKALDGGAAT